MKRKVFFDTLKKHRAGTVFSLMCILLSALIFYLYGLPAEPFLYALILISAAYLIFFATAYAKEISKAEAREKMIRSVLSDFYIPEAYTLAEEDYRQVIILLKNRLTEIQNEYANLRKEEIDYYTSWVHQIKTPISVMRLELGSGDTLYPNVFETELFRIEEYVDMVLKYISLGDAISDLVIKEYPLDELIRESVRKYAFQFVSKKLGLNFEGTDAVIVTDKKWFSLILEQILSNAVKYTSSGNVSICFENGILSVSDTGMGIASEDIPRIFEKGFTGENGRTDKRSSGLGLYLCKKAANLISIPLFAESTVGKGSTFSLDLREKIQ